MGAIASQITSKTIIYSTVCSDADQRKHQSFKKHVSTNDIHMYIPMYMLTSVYPMQTNTTSQYTDVIKGAIASQITSLTIVYLTINSDADQRKYQSSAWLAFVRGIHRGPVKFPEQMASNAENISIWWRHHDMAVGERQPGASICLCLAAVRPLARSNLDLLDNNSVVSSRCRGHPVTSEMTGSFWWLWWWFVSSVNNITDKSDI